MFPDWTEILWFFLDLIFGGKILGCNGHYDFGHNDCSLNTMAEALNVFPAQMITWHPLDKVGGFWDGLCCIFLE